MLAKTTSLAVPKKTYLNHQLLYKNACITAKSLDYSKVPALESRTKHYNSSPFIAKKKMQETVCPRQDSLHSISLQNMWCPSGISSGTPAIYNLFPSYWKYFFHFEIQFQFYADRI